LDYIPKIRLNIWITFRKLGIFVIKIENMVIRKLLETIVVLFDWLSVVLPIEPVVLILAIIAIICVLLQVLLPQFLQLLWLSQIVEK
jgi:hypothetical protein